MLKKVIVDKEEIEEETKSEKTEEEVAIAPIKIEEQVKVRKVDIKDPKKRAKLDQMVKFSFQETLKLPIFLDMIVKESKKASDLIKLDAFRDNFMKILEGQLYFGGFLSTIAIIGQQFSYELKASKHSVAIYEIAKKGNSATYYLMLYEMAYLNISSPHVMSEVGYQKVITDLRESSK